MEYRITNIWNKFWRDKKGRVVVWQNPNIFLIVWVVMFIISLLMNGKTANVIQDIGIGSLIIWSVLEIIKGVNYFRRTLGGVVLILCIVFILHIA